MRAGSYVIMTSTPQVKAPVMGVFLALGGGVVLSVNDLAIKALSGSYALHQVILVRAFISLVIVLAVMVLSPRGFRHVLTGRPVDHCSGCAS
jgi:drug/metabolite transporter (DMT)-like permease